MYRPQPVQRARGCIYSDSSKRCARWDSDTHVCRLINTFSMLEAKSSPTDTCCVKATQDHLFLLTKNETPNRRHITGGWAGRSVICMSTAMRKEKVSQLRQWSYLAVNS